LAQSVAACGPELLVAVVVEVVVLPIGHVGSVAIAVASIFVVVLNVLLLLLKSLLESLVSEVEGWRWCGVFRW